jgi:hypothetical protein
MRILGGGRWAVGVNEVGGGCFFGADQFQSNDQYMDHIVREATEIELHPNNMNICFLKNSLQHDTRYRLRGHTMGSTCPMGAVF